MELVERNHGITGVRPQIAWAVAAGVVGTVAMTVLMYAAPLMGMPRMDIATMLGTMFTTGQGAFWLGLAVHLVNGELFAVIFASVLALLRKPGSAGAGLVFGAVLWLVAMLAMGMMGAVHPAIRSGMMPAPGLFLLNMGVAAPIGSLVGHLLYGGVVGWVYGNRERLEAGVSCPSCVGG